MYIGAHSESPSKAFLPFQMFCHSGAEMKTYRYVGGNLSSGKERAADLATHGVKLRISGFPGETP